VRHYLCRVRDVQVFKKSDRVPTPPPFRPQSSATLMTEVSRSGYAVWPFVSFTSALSTKCAYVPDLAYWVATVCPSRIIHRAACMGMGCSLGLKRLGKSALWGFVEGASATNFHCLDHHLMKGQSRVRPPTDAIPGEARYSQHRSGRRVYACFLIFGLLEGPS